jgi:hypothetical protein
MEDKWETSFVLETPLNLKNPNKKNNDQHIFFLKVFTLVEINDEQ